MIRFLDGPAKDVELRLRRAPILLRAVRSSRGNWDALDQLDDQPRPGETIVVYVRATAVSTYHLCVRGRNRAAGGFYLRADYRVLDEQPEQDHVRETAAWQAWVNENLAALTEIHFKHLEAKSDG